MTSNPPASVSAFAAAHVLQFGRPLTLPARFVEVYRALDVDVPDLVARGLLVEVEDAPVALPEREAKALPRVTQNLRHARSGS